MKAENRPLVLVRGGSLTTLIHGDLDERAVSVECEGLIGMGSVKREC